jgi:fucose 4-O-acetylase-like acetyltransferase
MFFMAFLGGIILLLGTIYSVRENKILKLLCVLGRSSLLIYILHTTFDVFIFHKYFGKQPLMPFAGLYLIHITTLWIIAYLVQKTTKGKKLPFLLTLVLGS